jgi:RND family efflux transporter MFP subunit
VTPRREATVSSKVTGKVKEVFIEEGMKVEEGQILARLDDSNAMANLRLAEAQLESAKAALGEIEVRVREAERELRRVSDLQQSKIATQSDLDRAEAEFNSNRARLERQQVEVSVADRQVALWRQQVDDNIIRAPFAGIVTSKNAQQGEMISPISAGGGFTRTGICTIVDMDSLEIEVDVNESYINRVEPGQAVEATLDAYSDWKIPCKVVAIIPTADRQKATVKVRVGFEKLDPRILPQMGVKVAFQGERESKSSASGVYLPKSAVRDEQGKSIVFVVANGVAERRAITVGEERGGDLSVHAGLTAGEKVIIDSPPHLKSGTRVREAKP